AGLILQSTFPSLAMFAARYWAPQFLLKDRYDSEDAMRAFHGPVLIIHGEHDELIPWRMAKKLADAAPRATFRIYDCGHGCWDPDHNSFWQDAEPFLRSAGVLGH